MTDKEALDITEIENGLRIKINPADDEEVGMLMGIIFSSVCRNNEEDCLRFLSDSFYASMIFQTELTAGEGEKGSFYDFFSQSQALGLSSPSMIKSFGIMDEIKAREDDLVTVEIMRDGEISML